MHIIKTRIIYQLEAQYIFIFITFFYVRYAGKVFLNFPPILGIL